MILAGSAAGMVVAMSTPSTTEQAAVAIPGARIAPDAYAQPDARAAEARTHRQGARAKLGAATALLRRAGAERVWLFGSLYPTNFEGLLACYIAAIPFFWNTYRHSGFLVW